VLHGYRRWSTEHTEHTSSSVALLRLPPNPDLPAPIRGRFVVHVRMAHVGDRAEGFRLRQAIRALAPVLLDTLDEIPMAALDLVHQDPPGPMPVCLPNFLARSSDPTDVVAAWPDDSRAALLAAKRRWDPANHFRLGHALLPAPADAP
jgi:hypothetical protein